MMYLLFRHHHIMPGDYFRMGYGEKTVTKAFMRYDIERRIEEAKGIENG